MMKKMKSLVNKKSKKPLYYKKSKAAKEEEEYNELYETKDFLKHKKYKQRKVAKEEEDSDELYGIEDARKPKKYKQHKAVKEDEESNVFYGIEDLTKPKIYKQSPSRMKKSSRYNREYEYTTDYDDEYGGNQSNYNYEKQIYDSDDEMLEYTTEDTSRYRRHPGRRREYYERPQTEYVDDSDDSDCLTCTSHRGQRSDYTSEYPSEYQHEEMPASRHRNMHKHRLQRRREAPPDTEMESSPYRSKTKNRTGNIRSYHREYEDEFDYRDPPHRDYDRENHYHRTPQEVYIARGHDGHKPFTHRQQHEEQTSASGSEMDLNEDEEEQETEEPGLSKNQSRYQVFEANIGENQGVFQNQPNPRERLLTVTEYDKSVPMVALKNKTGTKTQDESQSIVYLPVVVMDDNIKLPHSKVVRAESILRTVRDKAEKPLETNMNVYVATENGQGNIFEQAQRNLEEQFITMPTDIQLYTAQSAHSIQINKKPSTISKLTSKVKSKSKSDYPVQKSYINVAPSRTIDKKESKFSVKSGGSKTSKTSVGSSLLGQDKPNSPKGSSYYANIHKKEIKDKKDKKSKKVNKSEDSSSALLSVINPSPVNQSVDQRTISAKGDAHSGRLVKPSASQTSKVKSNIGKRSAPASKMTNQSTFDRRVPLLKLPSHDQSKANTSTMKHAKSNTSLLERQCSTGTEKDKTIITIKDVTNGPYEESKDVFNQSEANLQPGDSEAASPKKKGLGSVLSSKKSKTKSEQTQAFTPRYTPTNGDPYTFNKDQYNSPAPSYATIKRQKSKEDTRKPKKSPSGKKLQNKRSNVGFSNKTGEFQFWKVLRFDSYAYTYIYQVVQYFLGLSIHGTLMEILRNSKQND